MSIGAVQTGHVMDNVNEMKPKFASIAAANSGDNLIIAGVAKRKLRVLSAYFVCANTVSAKFRSNTTDINGLQSFAQNSGIVLPFNHVGWFETAEGEALNLNLSGAVTVGGAITYVEVPTDR